MNTLKLPEGTKMIIICNEPNTLARNSPKEQSNYFLYGCTFLNEIMKQSGWFHLLKYILVRPATFLLHLSYHGTIQCERRRQKMLLLSFFFRFLYASRVHRKNSSYYKESPAWQQWKYWCIMGSNMRGILCQHASIFLKQLNWDIALPENQNWLVTLYEWEKSKRRKRQEILSLWWAGKNFFKVKFSWLMT